MNNLLNDALIKIGRNAYKETLLNTMLAFFALKFKGFEILSAILSAILNSIVFVFK